MSAFVNDPVQTTTQEFLVLLAVITIVKQPLQQKLGVGG